MSEFFFIDKNCKITDLFYSFSQKKFNEINLVALIIEINK